MKEISKVRFDALAGYARQPTAYLWGEEVRWLQAAGEALLIVVIRDFEDDDFSGMFFARDLKERFRWLEMTAWVQTADEAVAIATESVGRILGELEQERVQGDEKGTPIEFFQPIVTDEKINPGFSLLVSNKMFSPARGIIEPMMRWHEDADGNFIEQFQSTGFDARLWELYLFAMLQEAKFGIGRPEAIPDFTVEGLEGKLCIEATTVNPSRNKNGEIILPPLMNTPKEIQVFMDEYMPIRFAGRLQDKLAKKYWERKNVEGNPFVLAIQDFHAPGSMLYTRSSLITYLYGFKHDWKYDDNGSLVITPSKIDFHRWETKELPSNFFGLPDSENISAVISNPSATISKFNRLGVVAGFGSPDVRLTRIGEAIDHDSNAAKPQQFSMDVNSPDYRESWIEGMDVYHNPRAKFPLSPTALPGAAHHRIEPDGTLHSTTPAWQPLASRTLISIDRYKKS